MVLATMNADLSGGRAELPTRHVRSLRCMDNGASKNPQIRILMTHDGGRRSGSVDGWMGKYVQRGPAGPHTVDRRSSEESTGHVRKFPVPPSRSSLFKVCSN